MSLEVLGLLMDFIVLGFLGAMIFYSLRLSKSLSDFRSHRQEFDNMIMKLMASIDQAERSIQNLKQVSAKENEDMNRMIRQSRALSEELQIINEAGESMAKRLEELAERNRKAVQGDPEQGRKQNPKAPQPYNPPPAPPAARENLPTARDFPSFMIRDPEYPPLEELGGKLESGASNDFPPASRAQPERAATPDNLQSQAERDLYNALRGAKKNLTNNKGRP